MFLGRVAECLTGEHGFYDAVFAVDGTCPTSRCGGRPTQRRRRGRAPAPGQAGARPDPDQHVPGPGPSHRPPRPPRRPSPRTSTPSSTPDLRADHLGPAPGVRGRRPGRARRGRWTRSSTSCATPTAGPWPSSTCTSRIPSRSGGSSSTSRASPTTLNPDEQRHILDRLNAAEVFERFLHTRYVGQKRFGLEGPSRPSSCSTPCSTRPPPAGWPRS
jgi:hypothetical protein